MKRQRGQNWRKKKEEEQVLVSFWPHSEKRYIQFVQQICSLLFIQVTTILLKLVLTTADRPIEFWFVSYFSADDRKDLFLVKGSEMQVSRSEDDPKATIENTKQQRILGVRGWPAHSIKSLHK